MSSEELKPCPFCSGVVQFHRDDDCSGCHYIQCGGCKAFFDFATGADPENACESVDALRALIAPIWNTRAQLAAIQQAKGEEVEVVGYRWVQGGDELNGYEQSVRLTQNKPSNMAARLGYEPVMTVAQHQRITAAMAAEVERLRADNGVVAHANLLRAQQAEHERDALRAELAAVKGQEAVATIEQGAPYEDGTPNPCKTLRWAGNNAEDDFPAGTKLYALPPASPDVEGLVNELQHIAEKCSDPDTTDALGAALSTWRQLKE